MAKESQILILTDTKVGSVERILGEKAALLKDFSGVEIGHVSLGHPSFYDVSSLNVKLYDSQDANSLVNEIYRDLSNFLYDPTQSNPYKLKEGANCQAISIVLKETLERNGIPAEYVLADGLDHMYVRASLDSSTIDLDLVQKKFIVKEDI